MKKFLFLTVALALAASLAAAPLTPDQKAQVEAKLTVLKAWGSAPEVIAGVKAAPPAWAATMTQDGWAALSVLSDEVKTLARNPLGTWLRAQKDPAITEAFVSRADGTKAGFQSKPTNWSHKGKAKHEIPMTGKIWIGEVETDASTGQQQVQVSFPVLDGTKVIGSVVVGLQITKL